MNKKPVLMYLAGIYGNNSKVHISNVWREPLCGTTHSRNDESDYVFSDYAYDLRAFFIEEGIDPDAIECKRCLNFIQRWPKSGHILWKEDNT